MDQRISLGGNCAPTYHLDRLGLRTCAYPFDWSKVNLSQLIQVLENDFAGYSDIVSSKYSDPHSSLLISNSYGIKFAHEVCLLKQTEGTRKGTNLPCRELFVSQDGFQVQEFMKKLERRIERFKSLGKLSSLVRFYRIEMSPINPPNYVKSIERLVDLLAKYFNNFVLKILIHKDYISLLEELGTNSSKIQLEPFDFYSEDWKMGYIDWVKFFD